MATWVAHLRIAENILNKGYEPNVKIARDKLEPIGINVSQICDDEKPPYIKVYEKLVL